MRLLTDGKVMVMIIGDRPEVEPVPLFLEQVSNEMDWELQNPNIKSLKQIQIKWPYLFDKKNLAYIPNLKFVEPDFKLYDLDVIDYSNGISKNRPHFLDYLTELNSVENDDIDNDDDDKDLEQIIANLKR